MSYILDALKKSDQLRKRGAAPTLQAAQVTVVAVKQPLVIYYGLFGVILLCGIAIGWLRPWQAATDPLAAKSPLAQTAVRAAPSEMAVMAKTEMTGAATQGWQAANMTPSVPASLGADAMKSENPSSVAVPAIPEKPAENAGGAEEQRTVSMNELPPQIQQEIPVLTIQLHAYLSKPSERLVSVNSKMLREGDSLSPGLRLERITPDGLIFSYKGYRFQHGIH